MHYLPGGLLKAEPVVHDSLAYLPDRVESNQSCPRKACCRQDGHVTTIHRCIVSDRHCHESKIMWCLGPMNPQRQVSFCKSWLAQASRPIIGFPIESCSNALGSRCFVAFASLFASVIIIKWRYISKAPRTRSGSWPRWEFPRDRISSVSRVMWHLPAFNIAVCKALLCAGRNKSLNRTLRRST